MSKLSGYIPLLIAIIFAIQTIGALTNHSWLLAIISLLATILWIAVFIERKHNNG